MFEIFKNTHVEHFVGNPIVGCRTNAPLNRSLIDEAEREITQWHDYKKSPLLSLKGLAQDLNVQEIYYKHEGPRFGLGSFKALGGAYAVLRVIQRELTRICGQQITLEEIRKGKYRSEVSRITVVTATDGNHGRSVAWGAALFGANCRIYIHAEVSDYRAEAMSNLGAEVIRVNGNYDKSIAQTRKDAKLNGWFIVSDSSWPGYTETPLDVMSGYGVMAREIINDLDEIPTHVFLQGGVGALAASVAAAFNQEWLDDAPHNIIVEPTLAPCLLASAKNGTKTIFNIQEETIMAGLSCGEPSEIAWSILSQISKGFIAIPDKLVAPVVRMLARPKNGDSPIEAGESAVAGLCGLICTATQDDLSQSLELNQHSRIVIIGSEGVTDPHIFKSIMEKTDACISN